MRGIRARTYARTHTRTHASTYAPTHTVPALREDETRRRRRRRKLSYSVKLRRRRRKRRRKFNYFLSYFEETEHVNLPKNSTISNMKLRFYPVLLQCRGRSVGSYHVTSRGVFEDHLSFCTYISANQSCRTQGNHGLGREDGS